MALILAVFLPFPCFRVFPAYNPRMPIGTAVHDRTLPLAESLNYRDWSGYYAVSAYEAHHEHEYNAIRNAAALIDVSPLFKYLVRGRDAVKLVDRVITRDASQAGDRPGVLHALVRRTRQYRRWHGDAPGGGHLSLDRRRSSLRWLTQNAIGLDVTIDDVSEQVAALALQGPTSARLLDAVARRRHRDLKYFRMTRGPSPASPSTFRAPATPAILATRSGWPWDRAIESGTR